MRDERGRLRRRANARGKIDQTGDDPRLIANLVQVPKSPADRGLRDLSDEREHRCVHSVSREQCSCGIEQARSRHNRVGLRFAGREGCAEREIGSALFVPCVNDPDVVGSLEQRVEERVVVHARERIDRLDAMRNQRADGCLGGRHAHRRAGWRHFVLLGHDGRIGRRRWSVQIAAALSRAPRRA